jgi:two-component system, chemotaxis family, response regulator WspR
MAGKNMQDNKMDLRVPHSRTMVLLVDDQAIVAEAVRRLLAGLPDIDLHYCADGNEAIKQANRIKPNVILQDLVMPSIDGLDLVQLYRANPGTAETPIVVLSSEEDPGIKKNAFALGADDYLVKLPDKVELIARIRYHSKAHKNRIQRDEAFSALQESQRQLMEANLELQRLTIVDSLTGLKNRRYFDEFIEDEWNRSIRDRSPMSVLLIDIDDFKRYNDTQGHLAGDGVLRLVAETLRENSRRQTDCLARFGGEEFGVILPSTSLAGAQILGEKYRRGVENLHFPRDTSIDGGCLSVSVGGATTIPQRGESFLLLVNAADKLLYQAKRAGKNRVFTCEHDFPPGGSRIEQSQEG